MKTRTLIASIVVGGTAVFVPAMLGGSPSQAADCPPGVCDAGKTLSAVVGNTGIRPVDRVVDGAFETVDANTSEAWSTAEQAVYGTVVDVPDLPEIAPPVGSTRPIVPSPKTLG